MVDVFEEMNSKYIQVVAGGVHSAVLTLDGEVYMCGINEKGTVPAEGVEPEGSTSEFTIVRFSDQIIKHGKMVMLAAGASFTAALTDKGTVVAWGNLRDSSGEIDVHPLLHEMKDHPVIIVNYKDRRIVKVAAGENHLVMLDESGHVLTFGDGTMGQLGRSTRTGTIRSKYMCDSSGNSLLVHARKGRKDIFFKNIFAGGFWTLCVSQDGDVFGFGLNNFDQLGIKMPEFDETKAGEGGEDERELRVKLPAISENWAGSIWTHMDGVQHLAARNHNGEIWVVGKNTDNALGLGTWTGNDDKEHWKYDKPQKLVLDENAVGVTAGLASTIIWTEEGSAYAFGCDTTGQLGLGIKEDDDEKAEMTVVPTPQEITSAHLDGHNIVGVSLADMHALFLARKQSDDEEMKEEKEEKKVNKVDKEHKKEATPVQRPEVEEKEEKVDEEKPDEKMDTSEDHADEENGTGTGAESDQGENATEAEPVPSTQDDQEEQTPAME
ncbi:hypothetical protein WR25_00648 [Diploscapter pachys]|uniref:RCC1-like domain-containing protein n=1 Tax=Diploscapter pachys TaxID=2018661 RepID=A0A2A2JIX6_9BILA|nr:hypothetical protein WR25_00648 [Diploscapter pachys]